MENIFNQIQTEVKDFIDLDVEVVDGYTFNQYDTIKRCHLYYNGRFEDDSDYNGMEKIFYNISKYRCDAATRLLDIDTKDIRLISNAPKQELATFLLEKELKQWMKDNNVAVILNRMAEELPIYGSVVLKKNKNADFGVEIVDLRRLFLDPSVEKIQDSRFITQKHYLTEPQLRAMDGKWENVDKVIKDYKDKYHESYEDDHFRNNNKATPYYVIYERYGEVPESWVKEGGDDEKMVKSLFITTDPEFASKENKEGEILFKSVWHSDYPFKDAHYSKTRGRWLGVGLIEELFPEQERVNEVENQVRVGMAVSNMVLFQTSDQTMLKNVLKDVESGDILRKAIGGEGILPVDNRIKNFNEFLAERERYDIQADRKSHANDVVRGGDIPASTPATNAIIQNNNSTSVFRWKRQNYVATAVKPFLREFVLPEALKDLNKEHVMRFTGTTNEVNKLDKVLMKAIGEERKFEAMLGGLPVTPELEAQLMAEVQDELKERGSIRWLKVKDKLYSDLDFQWDIDVDGEAYNSQLMMQNVFAVMTALAQNPGLLNDPRIKTLFYKWMEMGGISSVEIDMADMDASDMQQMQQPLQEMAGQINAIQAPGQEQAIGRPQLTQ